MDILKKLTPAQIKMIIEPNKSKLADLLRLTFLDLLLKRVIAVREVEQGVSVLKQVYPGEHLKVYQAKPHEKLFTSVFERSPDLTLSLYEMMKLVRQEIGSSKEFRWECLIQPELGIYFKSPPALKFLRRLKSIRLSGEGEKLQEEIKKFINDYSSRVKRNDLKLGEVKALYNVVGTNFLLFDWFNAYYLKGILKKLERAERKKRKRGMANPADVPMVALEASDNFESPNFTIAPVLGGVIIYELLEQLESIADSVSHSFSSSFDSYDSSGPGWFDGDFSWDSDSSSWGDSGCSSGCSGCGGCGGN